MVVLALIMLSTGLWAQSSGSEGKAGAFTGYFNITDMGLLIGSPENQHPAPFSFMTINGYHLTPQFSTGLGVGLEFPSGSYMPLVLDARYYIRATGFSPFFFLYGGYALPLDDEGSQQDIWYDQWSYPYPWYKPYIAKGGWLLNPGFGIRHVFGENFGVNFSVGYRVQRLYYRAENGNRLLADYNRLMLKVGITFR